MPEAEIETAVSTAPVVEVATDETDWKAEARKWETRAKENSERIKQLEVNAPAQATPALAEFETRLTAAETRATTSEETAAKTSAENARLAVALDKGITKDNLPLLTATTREALEVQADAILKLTTGSGRVPGQGGRDATVAGGNVAAGRELFDSSRKKSNS